RSVIRIIATTRPSLNACSFVSLLQVQTKSFLAVNVLPSCSTRSSPSVIWQIMAFIIGGAMVFDPGCMMMSRIETVLKPEISDGASPSYDRTTTPGQGVSSEDGLPLRLPWRSPPAQTTGHPRATADLRSIFFIGVLLT